MDKINSGDTAWLLASAALVMLMTPALGFFYGGLVRRKNVLATIIVGVLLLLSLILVISTVAPAIDVTALLKVLAPLISVVIAGVAVAIWWRSRRALPVAPTARAEREGWRMPALALLERPRSSPLRRAAMLLLGSYVVLAVILLAVKAIQIGTSPH